MICELLGDIYRVHWPRKLPEKVYIRYGRYDNRSGSRNHFMNFDEGGVSVYKAILDPENLIVSLAPDANVSDFLSTEDGRGRLVFPVTGREVGIGSDGEPLLRGVRMLPYAINIHCRR